MLDFNHTCPVIDRGLETMESTLKDMLEDVLSDSNPLLKGEAKQLFIKDHVDHWFNSYFTDIFEEVRKTNIDMRSAADEQLLDLEREKSEAEDELEEVREELERTEGYLRDAQDELNSYEKAV